MKKVIRIILLFICLFFFGCVDNGITAEEYFDLITIGISDEATSDLNLMKEIDGLVVSYESSNTDVLTNDGKIYPKEEDVKVDLYIIIKLNGEEHFTIKTITVKGVNVYDYSGDLVNLKNQFDRYDNSKYSETNYKLLEDLYNEAIDKIKLSNSKEESDQIINNYIVKFDSVEKNISIEEKLTEIEDDLTDILILNGKIIYSNINLKSSSLYNSTIVWMSSDQNVLTNDGVIGNVDEKTSVSLSYKVIIDNNEYDGLTISLFVDKSTLPSYYSSIDLSLTGNELKSELRTLITTTHKRILTYDDLRQLIATTDKDPNNSSNLILLYTRVSVPSKWDGGTTWNREHVWPQSTGWNKSTAGGADIHHIRPTNNSANSSRGNKPYGEVSHTENNRKKVTVSGYGSVDYGYANSNFFEPLDEVKGDIARIIFYLLVRYSDADSKPVTRVSQSMEMLLRWNELDPVDDFEMTRNEESFKIQGNRNPFIDDEGFASKVFGVTTVNIDKPIYYYIKKEEFYI